MILNLLRTLQQHLPFTVLKPNHGCAIPSRQMNPVATAPTVYGIETWFTDVGTKAPSTLGCNSTYRLRY